MTNTCSVCGLNLDLVGRVHRCIPRSRGPDKVPDQRPSRHGELAPEPFLAVVAEAVRKDADPREPFDRKAYQRSYMREYMRKKRAS